MPTPDKSTYRLAVTRPVWLPFNNTAKLIVDGLMSELGYPTTGPKAVKYAIVVASVLKAAQPVEGSSRSEQPTLFNSLLGYKLGGLKASDQWDDVYAELSHLAPTGIGWAVLDDTIDTIDMMKRNRSVAKKVVMALIGSGISLKAKATDDLAKDFGLADTGWKLFRDQLIKTIPAFDELEPRYNSKGDVDGYLNGAGFLSYHESEIMLKTLRQLVELGIPAYPVHDSLMVKVSDATVAANTFRQVIHDYCKQLSGLEVLVPLSVTVADGISKELLPSNKELKGLYLS
jgi:hypothetical protein